MKSWIHVRNVINNGKKLVSQKKVLSKSQQVEKFLLSGGFETGRDIFSKILQVRSILSGKDEEKFDSYFQKMESLIDNFDTFETQFSSWKNTRSNTIKSINDLADEIKKHYQNCQTARQVGIGASIGGGLCFIGGFIATCTGVGAIVGIPLMGAGSAVGIGGGATNAGASITDSCIQENLTKQAKEIVEEDQKKTKELTDLLNLIEKEINEMYRIFNELKESLLCKYEKDDIIFDSLDVGLIVLDAALTGYSIGKEGFRGAATLGKSMRIVAPILAVVGLSLDIWEAVSICQEKATPESSKKLRESADELENQKKSFEEIFDKK